MKMKMYQCVGLMVIHHTLPPGLHHLRRDRLDAFETNIQLHIQERQQVAAFLSASALSLGSTPATPG